MHANSTMTDPRPQIDAARAPQPDPRCQSPSRRTRDAGFPKHFDAGIAKARCQLLPIEDANKMSAVGQGVCRARLGNVAAGKTLSCGGATTVREAEVSTAAHGLDVASPRQHAASASKAPTFPDTTKPGGDLAWRAPRARRTDPWLDVCDAVDDAPCCFCSWTESAT